MDLKVMFFLDSAAIKPDALTEERVQTESCFSGMFSSLVAVVLVLMS